MINFVDKHLMAITTKFQDVWQKNVGGERFLDSMHVILRRDLQKTLILEFINLSTPTFLC